MLVNPTSFSAQIKRVWIARKVEGDVLALME